MISYFKSHINITSYTTLVLTVITQAQIVTAHCTQIDTDANHATLTIKLTKLLHTHASKTSNQNLKILRTPMTLTVLIATLTLHQTQE